AGLPCRLCRLARAMVFFAGIGCLRLVMKETGSLQRTCPPLRSALRTCPCGVPRRYMIPPCAAKNAGAATLVSIADWVQKIPHFFAGRRERRRWPADQPVRGELAAHTT